VVPGDFGANLSLAVDAVDHPWERTEFRERQGRAVVCDDELEQAAVLVLVQQKPFDGVALRNDAQNVVRVSTPDVEIFGQAAILPGNHLS